MNTFSPQAPRIFSSGRVPNSAPAVMGRSKIRTVFDAGARGTQTSPSGGNATGDISFRRTDQDRRPPRRVLTGLLMGDPKPGRFPWN